MSQTARDLLDSIREQLAPTEDANRLIPRIEAGTAPRSVLAALAGEQHRVITSDWRSFLSLAAAAAQPEVREFFTTLAQGEKLALEQLRVFGAASGMDAAAVERYEPRAGCQGYPSYLCWLAHNADPADVVLAVVANFAAWGRYCARVSTTLRGHYGFTDEQCGFFDFFAQPAPDLDAQALAAVDAGRATIRPEHAARYGRMLQAYELMFWNTLADLDHDG